MSWGSARIVAVLMLVLVTGLVVANLAYAGASPGGFHFLPGWLAAGSWLREGVQPYAASIRAAAERMMHGGPAEPQLGESVGAFVYPAPALIFFLPFSLLPYETARGLWLVVLEVSLIAMVVIGPRLRQPRPVGRRTILSLIFAMACLHSLQGLLVGQLAILEALLVAGILLAIARDNDTLAGTLLGLAMVKPQMSFLLVPFVLLWSRSARRWSIPAAWAVTLAVLIGGSLLLFPQWPLQWAREVALLAERVPAQSALSALIVEGSQALAWIVVLLSGMLLLYLVWEWNQTGRQAGRQFQWTAWLTVVVGALIGPRWTSIDNVVLIPAWLWLFEGWSERWGRQGGMLSLLAGAVLIALPWGITFRSDAGAREAPGLLLAFPLMALLGLWWHRWWAIRADALPL